MKQRLYSFFSPLERRIADQPVPCRPPGFTLVELLTAMAVLGLILVMFFQVVSGILQSTRTQNQQIDSVASARRALDVISADLQSAVIGENAAVLAPQGAGADIFSLLTARRGPSGAANHRFLAVRYFTTPENHLIRAYGSVDYSQEDLLDSPATTAPEEPLAKGILAIQARAVADGTNAYLLTETPIENWATSTYNQVAVAPGFKALLTRSPLFAAGLPNRTRAIEIWIIAVDEQNYELLKDSGQLAAVQQAIGSDPVKWRAAIDDSTIPSQAKSGIRVLNKTIPLR